HSLGGDMRKISSILLAVCLLVTCGANILWAQGPNQGSIEGTVTDPSGAVVPGATLTVSNAENGITLTTQTNQDGLYRFAVLPVGTYDLSVQRPGFASLTRKA